jgi:hypothetical protein
MTRTELLLLEAAAENAIHAASVSNDPLVLEMRNVAVNNYKWAWREWLKVRPVEMNERMLTEHDLLGSNA